MYWQVTLALEPQSSPAAEWLPEKWTPAPKKRPAPPDANTTDTRSVFTNQDQIYVAMTEAILRLIARYPGLVDKVAHTLPFEPGQPRKQHFDGMMEAVSRSAPHYPGLGRAIGDTLHPFSNDPIWKQ